MDQDAIFALLPEIYACALAPELWHGVSQRLSDALNGATAVFHGQDRDGNVRFLYAAPSDPYYERMFLDNDGRYTSPRLPPMARLLAAPAGTLLVREQAQSDRDFRMSDVYNELFRPLGVWHWSFGPLLRDPAGAVVMALVRRASVPFDDRDLGFLTHLSLHLARAFQVGLRAGRFAAETRATDEILDRLSLGVILLDAGGRVLRLNPVAESIVARADGLAVVARLPAASLREQTVALRRLIGQAAAASRGCGLESGGTIAISRPSGARAYAVVVTPLRASNALAGTAHAAAALFISDPDAVPVPPARLLAQLYGLTHRQAALAHKLAEGESLDAAAEALGISRNTARTHLRRIFDRTGTNRQSELARLVSTSAPSLHRG